MCTYKKNQNQGHSAQTLQALSSIFSNILYSLFHNKRIRVVRKVLYLHQTQCRLEDVYLYFFFTDSDVLCFEELVQYS